MVRMSRCRCGPRAAQNAMRDPAGDQLGCTESSVAICRFSPLSRFTIQSPLRGPRPAGLSVHAFGCVDDLPAAWRPCRVVAAVRQPPHGLARTPHDEDAAAVAAGSEDDSIAVRREGRLLIVGRRVLRKIDRGLAADALEVGCPRCPTRRSCRRSTCRPSSRLANSSAPLWTVSCANVAEVGADAGLLKPGPKRYIAKAATAATVTAAAVTPSHGRPLRFATAKAAIGAPSAARPNPATASAPEGRS